MIRGLFYAAGFLLWSALAAPVVLAAEAPPLRVGRVAAVEGSVAVRAGTGDWADAHVNDPVAAGMSVRTGAQGRAVLRIGAETVALTSDSEVELTDADAGATRLVLRRGRLAVVLSPADPVRAVDVAVEGRDVSLATPGAYDITSAGARTVAAGAAVAPRDGDPVVPAGGEDAGGFVAWAERQAGDDSGLQALHCVSPDLTGYETLDANGGWETVNGYGMVWFPRDLPEDWAPYRYGHWRWVAAWGWNWIDDMPWGFATSHYGRWASVPGADVGTERWGWVPGDRVANPAYAPALVAFLGTPGVGLSYSGGSGPAVAWFPLAPGEVYWPRYGGDPVTIRRSNAGAVDDMTALEPAPEGGPPLAVLTADRKSVV